MYFRSKLINEHIYLSFFFVKMSTGADSEQVQKVKLADKICHAPHSGCKAVSCTISQKKKKSFAPYFTSPEIWAEEATSVLRALFRNL